MRIIRNALIYREYARYRCIINTNKGQTGNLHWEITEVRIRKGAGYAEPYTGIVNVKIVNNELFVEGLHFDEFTVSDMRDLRSIMRQFGFKKYNFIRYKTTERK